MSPFAAAPPPLPSPPPALTTLRRLHAPAPSRQTQTTKHFVHHAPRVGSMLRVLVGNLSLALRVASRVAR